ncbi:MAG: diguanylate cyclase, partial [Frankiaceae bacterium]|nr:diguanylate cyclase [Frankiaceae bacterium]
MGNPTRAARRSTDWRVPAYVRWSPAILVPVALLYVASTVWRFVPFQSSWFALVLNISAAGLTGARAVHHRSERAVWVLACAAITAWMTGSIVYYAITVPGQNVPVPSLADLFWLAFYPLMIAAVVLRIRRRVHRRLQGGFVLDGLIAGLGACAIMVGFVVGPLLGHLNGSIAQIVTNAAYPIGDELLLGMAVAVLAVSGRLRLSRGWVALIVAQVLYMAADTIFLTRTAGGTYVLGSWLDTLWVLSGLVVAFAAWQAPGEATTVTKASWRVLVIPYAFTIAALVVLLRDHWTRGSTLAIIVAALTLLVAAGRTFETLRQLRALGEARRQAASDDVTGLANRRELFRVAREATDGDPDARLWMLSLDIDLFKDINDTLGHQAGDDLITHLGPRLVGTVRPNDLVARIAGGQFAVLLQGLELPEVLAVAERLRAEVALPTALVGADIVVSATVGVAGAPLHTTDIGDLLRYADTAMYRARKDRLGAVVFDESLDRRDTERLVLIQELRAGLGNGEVVLYYQPKATLVEGAVVGVEALVRWNHPRHGTLVPPVFLPLAEQAGLMPQLTAHVLETAIRQAAVWSAADQHICISVNVTAADVRDPDFPAFVQAKLAAHDVDPHMLMLEITEQDLVLDRQQGAGSLDQLR